MRVKIAYKCQENPSLDCAHPVCVLQHDAFVDAAIEWIITIPTKIYVNNQETSRLMRRCDVAICFKGKPHAIKYFENYRMNKQACEELQAAGREFKKRWEDYRLAA